MPTSPTSRRWHRDRYAEAVWLSSLRPAERLVALCYADHAGSSALAWVTWPRLVHRTGLSRSTVAAVVKVLVDAGWLTIDSPAAQWKAPKYLLTIPDADHTMDAQGSSSRTPQGSRSWTPEPPPEAPRGPALITRGPDSGPNCSSTSKDALPSELATVIQLHVPPTTAPAFLAYLEELHSAGSRWPAEEVRKALTKIAAALGGDAQAHTRARTCLLALASRTDQVRSLGAFIRALEGAGELADLPTEPERVTQGRRPRQAPPGSDPHKAHLWEQT